MPWRERRQVLAELYLRRGFVDSAAEEWLAVCERDGVDATALRGLAAVATARGLDEDATVFVAEADALAAPDRAQVLVTSAESSHDQLGHGRPDQHFTEELSAL